MEMIDDLQEQFTSLLQNIDYSPIFPLIEQVLQTSIDRNFSEGGRYGENNQFGGGFTKWKKSKRAMKQNGQTLVDTGQLAASIRVNVAQESGLITVEIGSNKVYAAIHNFGGQTGRNRSVTMPARPFLVIQDEDIEEIQQLIVNFLKS